MDIYTPLMVRKPNKDMGIINYKRLLLGAVYLSRCIFLHGFRMNVTRVGWDRKPKKSWGANRTASLYDRRNA